MFPGTKLIYWPMGAPLNWSDGFAPTRFFISHGMPNRGNSGKQTKIWIGYGPASNWRARLRRAEENESSAREPAPNMNPTRANVVKVPREFCLILFTEFQSTMWKDTSNLLRQKRALATRGEEFSFCTARTNTARASWHMSCARSCPASLLIAPRVLRSWTSCTLKTQLLLS